MRKLLLLFLLLVILYSCRQRDAILPGEQMQSVLWDLLLSDEMAGHRHSLDSTLQTNALYNTAYDTVFSLHRISRSEFKISLHFYQLHPELLNPILDTLQKRSERRMLNAAK